MSHPLLVMPLPFRTVRSLRRRSKDNTGLNLQGPDVNRESREQISGQHRGVRRSPWMPPSPLPPLNEAEKGPVVAKSPFGPQTAVLYEGILGEFGGGLGAGFQAPPRGAPAQLQPVSAGFAGSRLGTGPLFSRPRPRGWGSLREAPPREPLKRNNVRN